MMKIRIRPKHGLLLAGIIAGLVSAWHWRDLMPPAASPAVAAEQPAQAPQAQEERDMRPWPQRAKDFVKPDDERLRETLTPLQYEVTQEDGTERAFQNTYWDNKAEGIYVDVVSGEPLFSSRDKYASGTGWPSFNQPIQPNAMSEHEDRKLFFSRTEVRSKLAGSHLGHLFDDGPEPTGLRYCVNSAALRFVALEDMEQEGYGDYLHLFQ